MNVDECFQLGYVIKRHGLSGEVNIFLDVDFPQEYQELESVFVEINDKLVPFFVDSLILKGNKAIVRFEDVNTVDGAEELKGKRLYLPLSNLPQLDEGQFYFHEIIGYQVMDAVVGAIGEVRDVYSSPQQDLLAVDHDGKEILIPIIDDIIGKADHDKKELQVALPEGLLDIYLD
ncbi:16S rRNA processing protein RimM [Fulvivirga imtechensis AK7]|uniref:Ribosome maturation factor RimM n=1 Tax=Fulvivirga imtechensis AK7 TaxID=1237149 RepID=L8JR81_9BACT|nr:ribosome maturation factor RimM [Fulvivirga imtechensis]ELR71370.1 16S rRNA processing protein RimM [Fulvivirga imtechensis AK7]